MYKAITSLISSYLSNMFTNYFERGNDLSLQNQATDFQGRLRVPRAGGARLHLRAHLCIIKFLQRGRFWFQALF